MSMLIDVEIKSPTSPSLKSPAQIRLESRCVDEKSPKSPAQIQAALEAADQNRKALLQARSDKSREQFEKAKIICAKQQESFNEMTQKIAEDIQTRLSTAESVRNAATEKIQERAGADYTKAKEAHAKKQQSIQSMQEMDGKIREKLTAAEERRLALLNEHKEKAAAQVVHAKDVAAQQEEKEVFKREELRREIQARLDGAVSRRNYSLAAVASPARIAGRASKPATPASAGPPGPAAASPAAPEALPQAILFSPQAPPASPATTAASP